MLDSISTKIQLAFKHLTGAAHLTEHNISSAVKDIRKALLEADVQYKIVKEFTDKIKQKAIGQKVLLSVRPDQLMVKIVQDELTNLLGGQQATMVLTANPSIVLVCGLQGSGKTTFCAKLAKKQKLAGRNPLLVAADTHRPAALEQLRAMGEKAQVLVHGFAKPQENPLTVIQEAIQKAKLEKYDLLIVDTAGRLAEDEELMQQLQTIKKTVSPDYTLFIVDAMTGQKAVQIASTFHQYLSLDGVVLSKLDGDTRGGAAFSVKYILEKPIFFVSNGEKIDDLDDFHPDRLAQRILGMGDIASLVEKAQAHFSEEQSKQLEKKIKQRKFDFNDFLDQVATIKKMGNITDLLSMIPGMNAQFKNAHIDEKRFVMVEAMILSMTPAERSNPDLLNEQRKKRIAGGCGRQLKDVNDFLHQFEQMRTMMQKMSRMPSFPGLKMPSFPKVN